MKIFSTHLPRLCLLLALVSTGSAAQLVNAPYGGQSAQRTGVLNQINVQERSVVISDQAYRLSDTAQLTAAISRRTGKHVRYTVVGEGGGQRGLIIAIEPAGEPERNRE